MSYLHSHYQVMSESKTSWSFSHLFQELLGKLKPVILIKDIRVDWKCLYNLKAF